MQFFFDKKKGRIHAALQQDNLYKKLSDKNFLLLHPRPGLHLKYISTCGKLAPRQLNGRSWGVMPLLSVNQFAGSVVQFC